MSKYTFNPAEKSGESLTVKYDIEHVYNATLKALSDSKGYKKVEGNKVLHRISTVTKASLFSWGERITVQLNEIEPQKTQISVLSELKTSVGSQGVGTQATIGKKNKKNIDVLFELISKYL
ncbi:hypothetical protein [Paenibacillus koleovorans]|uniref:hypothetical protein n=1 Tax=Paenibacillus koleovorans TaxID=121608 RepID=UPI000FDA0B64|nr:hypothetical protein [Paenibacillus koleovorans]